MKIAILIALLVLALWCLYCYLQQPEKLPIVMWEMIRGIRINDVTLDRNQSVTVEEFNALAREHGVIEE